MGYSRRARQRKSPKKRRRSTKKSLSKIIKMIVTKNKKIK